MSNILHQVWQSLLDKLFGGQKKEFKLGLYGPPNSGKSTLANRICQDTIGQDLSTVSATAHETREVLIQKDITIKNDKGKQLMFSLVDTPGIATRIDYEDFVKKGIEEKEAKERAKEATKGVVESIKWLDNLDAVAVVLDATQDPYQQVNVTILGNLEARNMPVVLVANKADLKQAEIRKIKAAYPQYEVVGISAKYGQDMDKFYKQLFTVLN